MTGYIDAQEQTRRERAEVLREAEERRRAEAAARREAGLQALQDDAAARLEAEREEHLTSWRRNGGTPEEFAAAWPEMKRQLLIDRSTRSAEAARRGQRARAHAAY